MSSVRRICDAVHVAALGIWAGSLGLAITAAAVVFPTLHDLDPHLRAFDAYTGPHSIIAGGQVANRVFLVSDIVQFACVLLAGLTFGIAIMWLGLSVRRVSTFLRAALLLGLVGVLAYRFGVVQPEWDEHLRLHWDAARAGQNDAAAAQKAYLDAAHPLQSQLMGATGALVVVSLVLAVIGSGREPEQV
jgi:hypothetical protein